MAPQFPTDITQLLIEWSNGSEEAKQKLIPIVYDELRGLASHYMQKNRRGNTLQTTALVHEAYLKLVDYQQVQWQNRTHFFALASRIMRHILVDHFRAGDAAKRGGKEMKVSLDEAVMVSTESGAEILALHDALERLEVLSPQQGQIVELRFFGGLTIEETAEMMGLSPSTIKREWNMARAWLLRELSRS